MTLKLLIAEQTLRDLKEIYEGRATGPYGLTLINQRAHAVQSGYHARAQGLGASLVVAALLHDIGHMVHSLGEHPAALGIDDGHEELGANWLGEHFGPEVTEPIRLHVAAKRYLCIVEDGYFDKLTQDSIESLQLQGGPMSKDEVTVFQATPYWKEAVVLRRIDELAKDPLGPMPEFDKFAPEIIQCSQAFSFAQGK